MELEIKPFRHVDPVINLNRELLQPVRVGPTNVTYQPISANNTSAISSTFNIQVPSRDIVMSRQVQLHVKGTLVFAGTTTDGGVLLRDNYDALASKPLNHCVQSYNVNVNNNSLSLVLGNRDIADALLRVNRTTESDQLYFSSTPSAQDFCAQYAGWQATNKNPLGLYDNGIETNDSPCNRGGQFYQIISNTSTAAQVSFEVWEPLICDPFLCTESDDCKGLTNINQITVTINWGNLSGLWKHNDASPATLTSITVANGSNVNNFNLCELKVNYYTLPSHLPKPLSNRYNVANINYYPSTPQTPSAITNDPTVRPAVTFSSNNISTNTIPRYFIIYAKFIAPPSVLVSNYADSFLALDNPAINISYMGKSGILSGATPLDLWNISRKNGLCMSYQQFTGQPVYDATSGTYKYLSGGPIILTPADLNLEDGYAQGMNIVNQFNVQCSFYNQTKYSAPATMYVITVESGEMLIHANGTVEINNALVSKADVIEAIQNDSLVVDYSYHDLDGFKGGFNFGNLFKKIASTAKNIISRAPELIKHGKEGFRVAKDIYGVLKQGDQEEKREEGAGGKHLSRSSLKKKMLKHYK